MSSLPAKFYISLCALTALMCWIAPNSLADEAYQSKIKPFLESHCIRCHGDKDSKGDIAFHDLSGTFSKPEDIEKWERILDMLEFGEMPPIDESQPTKAEVQPVKDWIESGMRAYVKKAATEQVEPKTRRLTNVEYQNTLRDLIGFQLDVMGDLNEDPEIHYGFNNTADLMRMGPEQLDRYLEIARKAMRAAIVDAGEKPEPFKQRREWSTGAGFNQLMLDEVSVFGNRRHAATDGMGINNPPTSGEFRLRVKAAAILPPGYEEVPLKIDMGTNPGRTETPYKTVGKMYLTNSPDEPEVFEFRGRIENIPTSPGPSRKNGPLIRQMSIKPRLFFNDGTLNDQLHDAKVRQLTLPRAMVSMIELEVPIVDVWPPKHHTDILFESPLREQDEKAYTREVIKRFMARAYRRPAVDADVDKFAKIFGLVRPAVETYEEAMRETLAMLMISPQFLYHTESDPLTDEQFALASRLSYFLWASMPDAELLELAYQQQLDNPKVIEQQVLRMLSDEKAHSFVEDFTMQWLSIRKMLTVPINKDLYPRFLHLVERGETAGTEVPYTITVRDYMMQETVGFVGELIKQNKSVLNVVDSDFAYLNERLAKHYGIKGVRGMRMRPVPIKPEDNLGGLLTQGTVLIGNGTGTAPHPIYRAVWLREAILGDHVADPPSDVPALEESAGDSTEGALSIAELLAKHRTVESCNDCHFRLDPWGLPFEDYNAIGRYQPKVPKDGTRVSRFDRNRHKDLAGYQAYLDEINTVEVMAKARVPHGPEVDGMRELKAHLLNERGDDVAENVIRRLLAYSIGRELTYRDRFAVEALFEQAEKNDFKMRDIIVSICKSDVFKDATYEKKD